MRIFWVILALLAAAACDDAPPCVPTCGVAVCGDDGCGGSCGECADSQSCSTGQCIAEPCGNGILDDGEACDDSSPNVCDPPSYCESSNACVVAVFSGSAATCDATCETTLIESCVHDDGCCPVACNPAQDNDCRPANCGNGQLDERETCDPPELPCPASCPNTDPCQTITLTGLAEACNAACTAVPITACYDMVDGCCPADCGPDTDADCAALACGNGVKDAGETCDPAISWPSPGACSPDCDDHRACTQDSLAGDAQACSTQCSHVSVTVCQSGDGCCPSTCSVAQDADCAAVSCGDGEVDGTEMCDTAIAAGFPGACPQTLTECDDNDPCTNDMLVGQAQNCSAYCTHTPPPCGTDDECCPGVCTSDNDPQCAALKLCNVYCGNADAYCSGAAALYADVTQCAQACKDFPIGSDTDATGNTLYCRLHHLVEAMADPDTHCPHAGPTPSEACID